MSISTHISNLCVVLRTEGPRCVSMVQCQHCHSEFYDASTLRRHVRLGRCARHPHLTKTDSSQTAGGVYAEFRAFQKHVLGELTACKARVVELEAKLASMAASVADAPQPQQQSITVNTTGNNNSNHISNNVTNNNITLNVFGKEDDSHISQQFREDCVRLCNEGILRLIKALHFDPSKPENLTFRIRTLKDFTDQGLIQKHGPNGWENCPKHQVLSGVWLNVFKKVNSIHGEWVWNGEAEERLGDQADQVASFHEEGERMLSKDNRGHAKVPRKYVHGIEGLAFDEIQRRRKQRLPDRLG